MKDKQETTKHNDFILFVGTWVSKKQKYFTHCSLLVGEVKAMQILFDAAFLKLTCRMWSY